MIDLRVRLTFPERLVRQPFVALLARDHGVLANIRRANVEDHEGWIVCELAGEAPAVEAAIEWLRSEGVDVDLLGDLVDG